MRINLNKKVILLIVAIIGIVVPFVPYITIIQMFLIIPFAILFITTFIFLISSLLNKNSNRRKAIFRFLILPAFISSQLLSVFAVDKIQRIRCEKLIKAVEEHRSKTGELPDYLKTYFGIEYWRMNDNQNFLISYSKGFMVTEKYQSQYKHWRSYRWND
jgi:hypothetical protein